MRRKVKGANEFKAYQEGKRITWKQAILAKCYDCMGEYEDGRVDCNIPACPLYPWMPYKNKTENKGYEDKCYG